MKYKITVSREWKEYGEVIVEDVENEDEARDEAMALLIDDDPAIAWIEENMEQQNQYVETIEKVEA